MCEALRAAGLEPRTEEFSGYPTFAEPFGVVSALALAPALLSARRRRLRSVLALAGLAGLALEGGLVRTPVSDALRRRPSRNVVAEVPPGGGETARTVCLMCHLDTSRSGWMFDPRFTPHLSRWLNLTSAAAGVQAAEPLLGGSRGGRRVLAAARAVLGANAALLAEREIRGEDVPGANDNASGVAVVATLALELARRPLGSTRVVVLMTGCEEAGTLGAQSFLRTHDTDGWLFLNFDNVGAGELRYLPQEGLARRWPADAKLQAIGAEIGAAPGEPAVRAAEGPIGLTYDATPVLARGGRAITFVAAGPGGEIPNYHWPTDVTANVEPQALDRAIATGRAMLERLDEGAAD